MCIQDYSPRELSLLGNSPWDHGTSVVLQWLVLYFTTDISNGGVHTCPWWRVVLAGIMFSEHVHRYTPYGLLATTGSSVVYVPPRTFPAGTWSNHLLGTNRPQMITHPKQVFYARVRNEQCSKWAGQNTQMAISPESAHLYNLTRFRFVWHVLSFCADGDKCHFQPWMNAYREL